MYRKSDGQMVIEEFVLPFEGKLRADNRWVKLAKLIPWDAIEEKYAAHFPEPRGNMAKPVRVALGALIIKEKCGYSDRETVEQIRENPYLQYFIGLKEYQDKPPFDPSLMVHFRKRLGEKILREVNEMICQADAKPKEKEKDEDKDDQPPGSHSHETAAKAGGEEEGKSGNQGKLILDATCAPADIRYPTDLSLLNEAREKLDKIIDTLCRALGARRKDPGPIARQPEKPFLRPSARRNPKGGSSARPAENNCGLWAANLRAVDRLLEKIEEKGCPKV